MRRCFGTLLALLIGLLLVACDSSDRPTLAFYLAVERDDIDQIERHIDWGADINQLNPDGRRPLHVAAAKGSLVVTRLLVKHGADINARDREDHTPLLQAIMNGKTQVAEFLIEKGAQFDANELLLSAARNQVADRDVYRLLVSLGADMNSPGADGETALITAIRQGARRPVKNLINYGADPNIPDRDGLYPLTLAEQLGDQDIIRLLRLNGARHAP